MHLRWLDCTGSRGTERESANAYLFAFKFELVCSEEALANDTMWALAPHKALFEFDFCDLSTHRQAEVGSQLRIGLQSAV